MLHRVIKERWSLLGRKLYYDIPMANKLFYAACILHNMLKSHGEQTELGPYWKAQKDDGIFNLNEENYP